MKTRKDHEVVKSTYRSSLKFVVKDRVEFDVADMYGKQNNYKHVNIVAEYVPNKSYHKNKFTGYHPSGFIEMSIHLHSGNNHLQPGDVFYLDFETAWARMFGRE